MESQETTYITLYFLLFILISFCLTLEDPPLDRLLCCWSRQRHKLRVDRARKWREKGRPAWFRPNAIKFIYRRFKHTRASGTERDDWNDVTGSVNTTRIRLEYFSFGPRDRIEFSFLLHFDVNSIVLSSVPGEFKRFDRWHIRHRVNSDYSNKLMYSSTEFPLCQMLVT